MSSADEFREARDRYRKQRQFQRTLIGDALRAAGWHVTKSQGSASYNSQGCLKPDPGENREFDLRNWMWITAKREGVKILVNFQILDQDTDTGNIHALIDRIGLEIFLNGEEKPTWRQTTDLEYSNKAVKQIDTGYTLPLSEDDLKGLVELIDHRVKQALS